MQCTYFIECVYVLQLLMLAIMRMHCRTSRKVNNAAPNKCLLGVADQSGQDVLWGADELGDRQCQE